MIVTLRAVDSDVDLTLPGVWHDPVGIVPGRPVERHTTIPASLRRRKSPHVGSQRHLLLVVHVRAERLFACLLPLRSFGTHTTQSGWYSSQYFYLVGLYMLHVLLVPGSG